MATILVDYENVFTTDGLRGVEYLNKKDTLIIFFSQCCEKIRAEYIEMIEKSQCNFKIYKLAKTGKNALDFYIAIECGVLSERGENQIAIISKDKGFNAVADFFSIKSEISDVVIRVSSNVENALTVLNDPKDIARRKLINIKSRPLNIEMERARINANKEFVEKIESIFKGTEFEMDTDKIIDFVKREELISPKKLYTGALHEFGREDGRAIYNYIKMVI